MTASEVVPVSVVAITVVSTLVGSPVVVTSIALVSVIAIVVTVRALAGASVSVIASVLASTPVPVPVPVVVVVVVVVVVAVAVAVAVALTMTMTMTMTVFIVAVAVVLTVTGVGPGLRIERRLERGDARAEPLEHARDHPVVADAQVIARHLRRQVSVAEVPGERQQVLRVAPAHREQRLGGGAHRDAAAVLEHETFAVAQQARLGQIEQEGDTAVALEATSTAMTIGLVERDRVVGRNLRVPVRLRALDLAAARQGLPRLAHRRAPAQNRK